MFNGFTVSFLIFDRSSAWHVTKGCPCVICLQETMAEAFAKKVQDAWGVGDAGCDNGR